MISPTGSDSDDCVAILRDSRKIKITLVPVRRIVDRDIFFASFPDDLCIYVRGGGGKNECEFICLHGIC